MQSYEHLVYDPIAFADELAKIDVMIAEKVKELKQQQEEKDEKERVPPVAANIHKSNRRIGGYRSELD